MTPTASQTTHHVLTGITIGGGALEWLTINSSAITALAVIATAVTSMAFGLWNAKSNSERNKVNRRDIKDAIFHDLEKAGKSNEYINDLKLALRMK